MSVLVYIFIVKDNTKRVLLYLLRGSVARWRWGCWAAPRAPGRCWGWAGGNGRPNGSAGPGGNWDRPPAGGERKYYRSNPAQPGQDWVLFHKLLIFPTTPCYRIRKNIKQWSTLTRLSTRSSRTTEALMEKSRRLRNIPSKEIKLIRMIAFTRVKQSSEKTFFFRLKLRS